MFLLKTLFYLSLLIIIVVTLIWILLARPVLPQKRLDKPPLPSDPHTLQTQVETLCRDFFPRSYEHPQILDKTADHIAAALTATGARVYEQPFVLGQNRYKNIIAQYGPDSPEVIVVGAHYDTAGAQPGADDNASGVAGLLELARLLATAELRARVLLVAYTLEETTPYGSDSMGSAFHARALKEQSIAVKLMMTLEMIGYFTAEPDSQNYPLALLKLFYPTRGDFIALVDQVMSDQARRMKRQMRALIDLPVHSINAPTFIRGVDFSDHRNYWQQGYPALMVTDTAFYRNHAYHSVRDTPDRLDYRKMAQVVDGVYGYVLRLANED
jgi:Zn-dependent M28 family amino/carboxypeptidase